MQLEIKTIIDFGEDGPPTGDMNDILKLTVELLSEHAIEPVCNTYGATANTMSGWTSSRDDEDEE